MLWCDNICLRITSLFRRWHVGSTRWHRKCHRDNSQWIHPVNGQPLFAFHLAPNSWLCYRDIGALFQNTSVWQGKENDGDWFILIYDCPGMDWESNEPTYACFWSMQIGDVWREAIPNSSCEGIDRFSFTVGSNVDNKCRDFIPHDGITSRHLWYFSVWRPLEWWCHCLRVLHFHKRPSPQILDPPGVLEHICPNIFPSSILVGTKFRGRRVLAVSKREATNFQRITV